MSEIQHVCATCGKAGGMLMPTAAGTDYHPGACHAVAIQAAKERLVGSHDALTARAAAARARCMPVGIPHPTTHQKPGLTLSQRQRGM